MNQIREKDIEARLREGVKKLGGRAYKFVSPGNSGVPDRLVCLPGGWVLFVELKAPGKKPTALQERQQEYLRGLGFTVYTLNSSEAVDELLANLRAWGYVRQGA